MSTPQNPLVNIAAVAVIIFSGFGIAHWLGWVGNSQPAATSASQAASAVAQSIPPIASAASAVQPVASAASAIATATPAPKGSPKPTAKPKPTPRPAEHQPEQTARPEPTRAVCNTCGTVTGIHTRQVDGDASLVGTVAGGAVGGVIGNQIGKGNGRTVAQVAGVIGGALLGREAEKKIRATTEYEVSASFEDGSQRTFVFKEKPALQTGEAVRLVGDTIVAR